MLVAAFVLAVGAVGVTASLTVATKTSHRSQVQQTIANVLQSEMEKIKRLPYAQIAHTTAPLAVADTKDPRSRIGAAGFGIDPSNPSVKVPWAISASGAVSSTPTSFQVGEVSGKVFRFVVTRPDPNCPGCSAVPFKQVVVAAVADPEQGYATSPYQELHADLMQAPTN
jgi:hypothetical protein